jgi:hypothetical protein
LWWWYIKIKLLSFWTLSIVLFLFITIPCLCPRVKTYSVGLNRYSPYVLTQGLVLSNGLNWIGFYLKTETESSLRKVVLSKKKKKTGLRIMSENTIIVEWILISQEGLCPVNWVSLCRSRQRRRRKSEPCDWYQQDRQQIQEWRRSESWVLRIMERTQLMCVRKSKFIYLFSCLKMWSTHDLDPTNNLWTSHDSVHSFSNYCHIQTV